MTEFRCSVSALADARSLAAESDACLIVVHALEWPWDKPPAPDFDELPTAERAALRAFRRRREQEARERLAAVAAIGNEGRIRGRVVHGKAYAAVLRVATRIDGVTDAAQLRAGDFRAPVGRHAARPYARLSCRAPPPRRSLCSVLR